MPAPEDIYERLRIATPVLKQRDPRLTETEVAKALKWTVAELSRIRQVLRPQWDALRRLGPQPHHHPNPRRNDPRK